MPDPGRGGADVVNPFPFGESILITRPPERDRFGDRPASPATQEVNGVGFAFASTDTKWPLDAEDRGIAEAELFMPLGTDIRKGDTVTRVVDGSTWKPVGGPEWNGSVHPMTGWSPGVFTQRIRRVT